MSLSGAMAFTPLSENTLLPTMQGIVVELRIVGWSLYRISSPSGHCLAIQQAG